MTDLVTEISYEFTFQAAHSLSWHPGKCRNLHGHSYRCETYFSGALNPTGIIVDFDEVDDFITANVMPVVDHTNLNDVLPNATVELIAAHIFRMFAKANLPISGLRLWETPSSSALVRPRD